MKILIAGLNKNPQLVRLKEEGLKRGHTVEGCLSSDLIINAQNDKFEPILIGKDILSYDLIYLWAVSKRRWEWYTTCYFLSDKGTNIVNGKIIDPSYFYYLSPAMDYLRQFENEIPFPKSAVILSEKAVDQLTGFSYPLIVKSASGRQGKEVFKVESNGVLKEKVRELSKVSLSFVVREFIPNDGDVRIFTIGYKAIGAMKRTPSSEGEFRSNISLGGTGSKFDLESYPKIKDIAEKLSLLTKTEIAGVDIMINKITGEPYVLEINPGPQFSGFEKYIKVNVAEEIIKYFESL